MNVEFVPIEIDETTPDDIQSLWQWVDETNLAATTRRELISNGLRTGRVIDAERFRSRLDSMTQPKSVVDQFLSQADVASEVSHGGRRIPMRTGRRYELPVRQPIEGSHVSLVRLDGELFGRTLVDPQFLLALTPTSGNTPQQINLRFRPEIQHGSMRQSWVSSDTALRIDTRRETWSIDQLDFMLTGVENDTFVMGTTAERIGLGKQMLSGTSSDNTHQQVVVLITLAQVPTPADQI
ncbi:MAG: hypothetical protein HKN47_23700 [Pirellulaceae bacterium]|nr:hypothetical protein [Pirellulaceae bacterium]